MDSLPFELITLILTHLPRHDLPSARLTCHAFNAALAKPTFSTLASFVDPAVAQLTIERLASDLNRRPKAIWSPGCSVPRGLPVPESFLSAMRAALRGAEEAAADAGSDITMYTEGDKITAENFGRSIGMDELTEDVLRQALFRYALYLSYVYTGEGEAPALWVMNSKKWAQQR
ncbi:hypothetical protein BBK36DRAFT_1115709 [Trichoderma citrinoviride]|uniref:F-box domain-containing protein n=1 Tax=Trichoderma citrinoviride TaxID=58853 RepID=A0A2T4BEB7_9HYPO|nr:hypothetical protein BBK36DRAFT_1115709 [Trichoderma citrinoviride]PTB67683.1 hypothetical protein BBK36DRAFT_1115709 [Trichoderma citrinoviride]